MRTCTVDGCEGKHAAKGLCKRHYGAMFYHLKRTGLTQRRAEIVHGTTNGYVNGFCRCEECRKAWAAYYRSYLQRRSRILGKCSCSGCTRGKYSRGMCRLHYEHARRGYRP